MFQLKEKMQEYITFVKAESLVINSVGQRPMKQNTHESEALKGRNQAYKP